MDYSTYEVYEFDNASAFNMSINNTGRSYPMHWHSYGEIMVVGSGKTNIYQVGKNTYHLSQGDILLMWPMVMHEIVDADRQDALIIQYSSGFINSVFELRRIMHIFRKLDVISVSEHPELVAKLTELTDRMKEIYYNENLGREIRCCSLLMEFMYVLYEHRNELNQKPGELDEQYGYNNDVLRRMIMVTDYIKSNLTADDLSQATMAKMAGISKDYFSRIFKNYLGTNYSKWLNMIRLEKASEYLMQEGRTLTEVAMLSGFQSISSFNRVFREEYGMSPREYRALYVKNNE